MLNGIKKLIDFCPALARANYQADLTVSCVSLINFLICPLGLATAE